jgi:hypothetical protein
MADNRPTPVTFLRAVQLCLLLLISPERFKKEEDADIATRNNYNDEPAQVPRAHIIRLAFVKSLGLVMLSGVVGFCLAKLTEMLGYCSTATLIIYLQIGGACILLWGTLFVRGWEIQSHAGVLFSERVNQWLYRFLYCLGTSIIVFSLSWSQCP